MYKRNIHPLAFTLTADGKLLYLLSRESYCMLIEKTHSGMKRE